MTKNNTTRVLNVRENAAQSLRQYYKDRRFELREVDHAHFQARGEGVTVTCYRSGSLVLQGKEADPEVEKLLQAHPEFFAGIKKDGRRAAPNEAYPAVWAGTDESGKGDLFGPLVVAGVVLKRDQVPFFHKRGLRDSKELSAGAVENLAECIQKKCPSAVFALDPPEYNRRYSQFNNLNLLLGWAHARVIERLVTDRDCELVITDKFGPSPCVRDQLGEAGREVRLVQRTQAESDPAVAAAAVLARQGFVDGIAALSRRFSCPIPLGAGPPAVRQAKKLLEERGEEALRGAAKTHFSTIRRLLEG